MNILNDIIKYICAVYPHAHELSNARLTKLIYLADWESIKRSGKQLTNINWYFDNYGPFVRDVYETAHKDPEVKIVSTQTVYGTPKTLFAYDGVKPNLNPEISSIIDKVILETQKMYWNEFIKYVYSTPPIVESSRYSFLELSNFNKEA